LIRIGLKYFLEQWC